MAEFKDRYVLGEGYPWAFGLGRDDDPYISIGLCHESRGAAFVTVEFPAVLWRKNVPRYRLVLERVGEEKS